MSYIDTRIFHYDKVGKAIMIPLPPGLQRIEFSTKQLEDRLRAELKAWVLTEHLADDTETATAKVPQSWVDHLKHDLQGWTREHTRLRRPVRWWIDRHPIKQRTITLSVTWHRRATRPYSSIGPASDLGSVIYQEYTERAWDQP